jgi:hypothetical protein
MSWREAGSLLSDRFFARETMASLRVEHSRFALLFSVFCGPQKFAPCAEPYAGRFGALRRRKAKRREVAAYECLLWRGQRGSNRDLRRDRPGGLSTEVAAVRR